MRLIYFSLLMIITGCSNTRTLQREIHKNFQQIPRNNFSVNLDSLVQQLDTLPTRQREALIVPMMLQGAIPAFNFSFSKVYLQAKGEDGKAYQAILFVSPDYICFGNDQQYMRIPLSPQAGQLLADSFHCVLPTTKMVDAIYASAKLKVEPVPLTERRAAFSTFLEHHRIIQEQTGMSQPTTLLAGTKKDVVQTAKLNTTTKEHRVAIYGWHRLNGEPIQPLYLGHVDWYVDYSHGIRMVYEKMILNGRVVKIKDVLQDEKLQHILCNETLCGYTRYPAEE